MGMVGGIIILLSNLFLLLLSLLYWRQCKQRDARQQQLRKAKTETRDIAQLPLNNPHPLIQVTEDKQVVFANFSAKQVFPGIEELGGQHPVLHGPLKAGQHEVAFDNKIYQLITTPNTAQGEGAFIIYFHDLTDEKHYQKRLKNAYQETNKARILAEKAKEARGDFLANMSHELRTPMNGIIGLSDILKNSPLPAEHGELAEAINTSARNLLCLLNDILDFSKIEAGELSIEAIPFDIRKTIHQIDTLQQPVARQKNIQLHSQISDSVPDFLFGDARRLQQILNNLVNNALKFTEEGSVLLSVNGHIKDKESYALSITVKDTGIGIPADKQQSIFEKFQQADTTTARLYGGTGLGLAITKQLVELMNGSITLSSTEGQGTAFAITLPVTIYHGDGDAQHQQGQLDAAPENLNTRARILIVDDHPINLLFLRKTLKRMGLENFDEASNGQQALTLYQENGPYDLILMDCQMPNMDGFETTRHIRKSSPHNHPGIIVAVTADAMKDAQEKCYAAGMDDYISKPVNKHDLYTILLKYLPRPSDAPCSPDHENNAIRMNNATNAKNALRPSKTDQTSMVPDNTDTRIFDWQRLQEFTDGNEDELQHILGIFITHLEHDLGSLQQSYDEKNYKDWDSWVHKLYGSCSHIGAHSMAKICDEGQVLYPDNTEKIPSIHRGIVKEYRQVMEYLSHRTA